VTHTPLTFEEHCAGIESAVLRMARWSEEAGPDTPVPTCPGWDVRDLLAHQGMVHRWATAVVAGEDRRSVDTDGFEAEGRAAGDPVAWLRAGATELLAVLRSAPEDLEAFTFLKQAPPARLFWARRQDHETTIHALDALAARDRRRPTADDAWFGAELALDGIDELLAGFWQRRSSGPRAPRGGEYAALVAAGAGGRWLLDIGTDCVRARHLGADEPGPDAAASVLGGDAVDLYLALWNRGGRVDDPDGLLGRWQDGGSVRW
jgi:uncharacterized protein (TIGR03083 family)